MLGQPMRNALGAKKLSLPGANVAEVLDAAARRGGDAMARALFAEPDQADGARGELNEDLRVLVVAGRAHVEGYTGVPDRVRRRIDLPRLVIVCGEAGPDMADVVYGPATARWF